MNTASAVAPALNPPVRILMGPGPSDIHPRVLEAHGQGNRRASWIPTTSRS